MFDFAVDLGLGASQDDYLGIHLHTFPSAGEPSDTFTAANLHGPIAALGPRRRVLMFDVHGPTRADMVELRSRLAERHVAVHDVATHLPHLAEAFVAIPAAVRAQQLALELARVRGIGPDRPFGLDKVKVTT